MEENRDRISIVTAEVEQETKKILNENIYKIILYGSYARGDCFIWIKN